MSAANDARLLDVFLNGDRVGEQARTQRRGIAATQGIACTNRSAHCDCCGRSGMR